MPRASSIDILPPDRGFALRLAGSGTLDYAPSFLTREEADQALTRLTAEVAFEQREIVLFGRRVAQPRLVAWMGDPGARYTYSGLTLDREPWHPIVLEMRERVSARAGVRFDSVLLNWYRDGRDSMGMHADDEPELGPAPLIASLSLGAERVFVMAPRSAPENGERLRVALGHGSLLVMGGAFQATHRHGLPKAPSVAGARVNLTFRAIVSRAKR